MVKIILITHGTLGECLLDTVSAISGCNKQNILVLSVSGKVNLEETENKIKEYSAGGGALVLVDSFGGTSCNIALKCSAEMQDIYIVCGVNLCMLLSALHNQEKLNSRELAAKVAEDGKKAIIEATEFLKK